MHVKDTQYNIFIFSAVVGNSSRKAKFDRVVFNVWVDRKYSNSTNFQCCLRYKSKRLLTTDLITKVDWLFIDHTKIQAKQYVFSNPRGSLWDTLVGATMVYNQRNCPKSAVWYVTPTYAFRHENEIAVCTKVCYSGLCFEYVCRNTWHMSCDEWVDGHVVLPFYCGNNFHDFLFIS